ncbi:hypothetical protein HanIR_Chr06g0283291 [Helianthus annuus]|nr:hypothetical protein HanIR_Chr06g0283291 [Helianthus annuus]
MKNFGILHQKLTFSQTPKAKGQAVKMWETESRSSLQKLHILWVDFISSSELYSGISWVNFGCCHHASLVYCIIFMA